MLEQAPEHAAGVAAVAEDVTRRTRVLDTGGRVEQVAPIPRCATTSSPALLRFPVPRP